MRGLAPVKGLPVSPLPRPRSVHPISVLVPGLPIPPLSQSCLSQPLPQCQACRPLCPVGCSGHSSCQALLAPLFLIAVSPLLDTLPSGLKLHVLTDQEDTKGKRVLPKERYNRASSQDRCLALCPGRGHHKDSKPSLRVDPEQGTAAVCQPWSTQWPAELPVAAERQAGMAR